MTAKQLAGYVKAFEAKRLEREAKEADRCLEVYSVRPHIEDRLRGDGETRYDVWEVDEGGIRWIEPANFYDWPYGGVLEHRNTPWAR